MTHANDPGGAGRLMAAEIAEQPSVFERILRDGWPTVREVARVIRDREPRFVVLAARGTSDHAALYARYLIEIELGLPTGLAAPSTITAYRALPDFRGVLYIGVSQSGRSPDLVTCLSTARQRGALTLAVTNAPDSPLAAAAELHLDMLAGPERAVAATKSYTASLLTLYLLVAALRERDPLAAYGVIDAAAAAVAQPASVLLAAKRLARSDRIILTGRGYGYPTALEGALKLMETSYLAAHGFSAADLLHGPVAMVEPRSPVIVILPGGVSSELMRPVLDRLGELGAERTIVGLEREGAEAFIPLPGGVPEELSPITSIIPLQMLARELALIRGSDPDAPRGLSKVTQTL